MEASEALAMSLAKPEKPKPTLWAISNELLALGEKIAENQGEITSEIEAELDALEGAFEAKAEAVYLFAKDASLEAEKAKAGKEHMQDMERYWLNKARGLKWYLLNVMERHGRDRVQTFRAKFSRVQSPPSYRWNGDDYADIPVQFRRTKIVHTLDVDAVKRAIVEGVAIPAEIVVERGHHIR